MPHVFDSATNLARRWRFADPAHPAPTVADLAEVIARYGDAEVGRAFDDVCGAGLLDSYRGPLFARLLKLREQSRQMTEAA